MIAETPRDAFAWQVLFWSLSADVGDYDVGDCRGKSEYDRSVGDPQAMDGAIGLPGTLADTPLRHILVQHTI